MLVFARFGSRDCNVKLCWIWPFIIFALQNITDKSPQHLNRIELHEIKLQL